MTDEAIEVTFTPIPADYRRTQRWIVRHALGCWYIAYVAALCLIAFGASFSFMLLIRAVDSYDNPNVDISLLALLLFVISAVTALVLTTLVRRHLGCLTYQPDGFFLAPRTLTFSREGIHSRGGINEMRIPWRGVLGFYEDSELFYLKVEPAVALFIPKRVIPGEAEALRLKQFIGNKLAESKAET